MEAPSSARPRSRAPGRTMPVVAAASATPSAAPHKRRSRRPSRDRCASSSSNGAHSGGTRSSKPTYASLIALAIRSAPERRLMLNEVYAFVDKHRSLVPTAAQANWKNSVRHNLSLRNCFVKIPRWTTTGKKLSAWWTLDDSCLPSAAEMAVQYLDVHGKVWVPPEHSGSSDDSAPSSHSPSDHESDGNCDHGHDRRRRRQSSAEPNSPLLGGAPLTPPRTPDSASSVLTLQQCVLAEQMARTNPINLLAWAAEYAELSSRA